MRTTLRWLLRALILIVLLVAAGTFIPRPLWSSARVTAAIVISAINAATIRRTDPTSVIVFLPLLIVEAML